MKRRRVFGALVIAAVLAWWPWPEPDFISGYCNTFMGWIDVMCWAF